MCTMRRRLDTSSILHVLRVLPVLFLLTFPHGVHPSSLEPNDDPYKILGVPRNADLSAIKSAYRKKARDTHPDKNKGANAEEAAVQFRRVVDAFEILSDEGSRRNFDRTGRTSGGGGGGRGRGQQQRGGSGTTTTTWSFTFRNGRQYASSGGGGQQHHHHRPRHKPQRLKDRPKAKEAQSRVMHVISLPQLRTVMLDENDRVERSLLMCFVTPGAVERLAEDDIVFPYPFAGMSEQKIWWEDILQTVQVKYNRGSELSRFFGLPPGEELSKSGKPVFVFVKRGMPLSEFTTHATSDRKDFEEWVWRQLHVSVEFVNRHTHPVELYWLDGRSAKFTGRIAPGESHLERTALSHEFWARDDRVDRQPNSLGRHKLNENSSLGNWKILTDAGGAENNRIYIDTRCADLSGHCEYWARLGECRKNPDFMMESCQKSCRSCNDEEGRSSRNDQAHNGSRHDDEL